MRGLDYYTRTVFEWITDSTGAQNAVCSGGRYDGLIAQLGGDATPAIGFAMGVERVVALLVAAGRSPGGGAPGRLCGRERRPGCRARRWRWWSACATSGRNCASSSTRAAATSRRSSAAPTRAAPALALIVGDDELARGVVAMKPLRRAAGQTECPIAQLAAGVDAALAAAGQAGRS